MAQSPGDDGLSPDTVLLIFFGVFVVFSLLVGTADVLSGNEMVSSGVSDLAAAAECCRWIALHIGLDLWLRRRATDVKDWNRQPTMSRRRFTHVFDSL